MMPSILNLLAITLILLGVAGTLFPILPGAPLIFIGTIIIVARDGISGFDTFILVVSAALTAISILVDFAATAYGAKRAGASKAAIVGATLGSLIGMFFLLPGIILGPFIGAVAGELTTSDDLRRAGNVGVATWLGLLVGTVCKLAIAFAMAGLALSQFFF